MPTPTLPRRALRLLWRRRRRVVVAVLLTILIGYSGVFAWVEYGSSLPAEEHLTTPHGARLAYRRTPGVDGAPPVILVHGAPADSGCWDALLAALPSDVVGDVYAVDRPGYGNSSSGRVLALDAHAAALHALAATLDKPPILVGHSYGGPVVLRYSATHPEWCGGLVLVAGATDPGMDDAQAVRRYVDALSPVIPTAWSTANAELLALTDENVALDRDLHRVACPVRVVHGSWDPVCPADGVIAHLQRSLVNAEDLVVHRIDRGGHNLHASRPDVLAEAIVDLSARIP